MCLVQCPSAASAFVIPLRAGFVVSLSVYCLSCAPVRQGGIVCAGAIFSMFLGVPFVISCIVDSLNLFGIPRSLLVGITGRGGGAALVLVVIDLAIVRGWDLISRFWRPAVLPPAVSYGSAVAGVAGPLIRPAWRVWVLWKRLALSS